MTQANRSPVNSGLFIFGGGVNAFPRYENSKTKPPLALVKLLKVLDRHPDLLNEVKAE
jgi:HTH-type transcriptional regulator/antitoxin MqsA